MTKPSDRHPDPDHRRHDRATAPAARSARRPVDGADAAGNQAPWWRVPMVWVVISGPLAVVVASLVTAGVAWTHIDPVVMDPATGQVTGHAGDDVAAPVDPKDPLAPAQRARNHSASPRE